MRSRTIKTASAILLAAVMLFMTACYGAGRKPDNTADPHVTEVPDVEYTMKRIIRYWPEDASYEDCDYACIADVPEFSKTFTYGYAMNAAVDGYLDKLAERIEKSYMPSSISKPPYTEVIAHVEHVGGVTNIVFNERHCYEAQPYSETYVIMLDERGNELTLCDVLLSYHAEELAARRISEMLAEDERYENADENKVRSVIDIRHGARATEAGCTVFVHEGLLAPYEEGELAFEMRFRDLLPDFAGEGKAVSEEEYRKLTEFFSYFSNAIIVRGGGVENGVLSAYTATGFMAEASDSFGLVPKAGRVSVPEAEFESYYRRCFGTEFPGIDAEACDIRHENGFYTVPIAKRDLEYHVDMLSAERSGEELVITGDMVYGSFGFAYSETVRHVTVRLTESADSPFGFILTGFEMKL